jgi:hypothetical protein
MSAYLDNWGSAADVAASFEIPYAEVQKYRIIAACYSYQCYEGDSYVLMQDGEGNYYEVRGGHCSCYGLEGQWEPEPITKEEILNNCTERKGSYYGAFETCIPEIRAHFERLNENL